MNVRVCIPWRTDHGLRERLWRFTRRSWEAFGWPIETGDVPGRFNRAAARNAAAAGLWDVAVFVDADTVVRDQRPTRQAIELAHHTGHVVQPHDTYYHLTASGTALVLHGDARGWKSLRRRLKNVPLGVLVVPRVAWDTLGGFDERFTGWGGEDTSFIDAARTLSAIERLPGAIYHLWHPNDATKRRYVAHKGTPLRRQYIAARGDAEAMRALLP